MHTLFKLCEWGLGIKSITSLTEAGIYLEDFYYNDDLGFKSHFKGISVYEKIKKIGYEKCLGQSVYELSLGGLSLSIIQKMVDNNVTFQDLTRDNLRLISLFSNSTYSKIMDSFDQISKMEKKTDTFVYNTLQTFLGFYSKKRMEVEDFFNTISEYPIEHLEKDLNELENKGLISLENDSIHVIYPSIFSLLEEKEEIKEIVIDKMNNLSLEEIGNKYQTTRESIRQKIEIYFDSLPTVLEDKYAKELMKYHWDYESFHFFYGVNQQVFNYLKYRFGLGEAGMYELIQGEITPLQRQYLFEHQNLVEMKNSTLLGKRDSILRFYFASYCSNKQIKTQEAFDGYHNFLRENKMGEEFFFKNLIVFSNYLERCSFALFGAVDLIRYWDFSRLIDSDLFFISKLLDLPMGYYSCQFLFRENAQMMTTFNFLDEYELFSFLKRITTRDDVTFKKSPTFFIGSINRDDFLQNIILRNAPIVHEDLLAFIEKNYGFQGKVFEKQLTFYKKNKITHEYLALTNRNDETELARIKEFFNFDIRLLVNFLDELKANYPYFSDVLLSKHILEKCGYYIYKTAYIVRNDITNVEQYLEDKVASQENTNQNTILTELTTLYFDVFISMAKRLKLILTPRVIYTEKDLSAIGITRELIDEYLKDVENRCKSQHIFSTQSITIQDHENRLEKMHLPQEFYESIIYQTGRYIRVRLSKVMFFAEASKCESIVDFFRLFAARVEGKSFDQISTYLKEKYDIDMNRQQIEAALFQKTFDKSICFKFFKDK